MAAEDQYALPRDTFERVRSILWGAPGCQHQVSTIKTTGWAFLPMQTWVVETIRSDDGLGIFIERIDIDGGQRIVLPEKVCQTIYNHFHSIKKKRRSAGAKRAMERRMSNPNYKPFAKKDEDNNGNERE